MREYTQEMTIIPVAAALKATFTAVAATNVITSAAHGYSDGDRVRVENSGGALPAGLSASTDYYVISAATNTFKLSLSAGGSAIDITDTGSGTNSVLFQPRLVDVRQFAHCVISFNTTGSAALTMKIQGTIQVTPNFSDAASTTNRWDYVQAIDLQNGASVNGDVGVAPNGTDDQRLLEVNINELAWLTVIISNWTAGNVNVSVLCSEN